MKWNEIVDYYCQSNKQKQIIEKMINMSGFDKEKVEKHLEKEYKSLKRYLLKEAKKELGAESEDFVRNGIIYWPFEEFAFFIYDVIMALNGGMLLDKKDSIKPPITVDKFFANFEKVFKG
jgi:hypothetical protein